MQVVHDEGSGPLVVLLHGQPGSAADFDRVRVALRGRGMRVLTVDRPGYDEAGASSPTGFAGNAVALDRLLETIAPGQQVLLVGLSWAGGVALALALRRPGRLAGILLVSSVGSPHALRPGDGLLATRWAGGLARRVLPALSGLLESSSGSRLTPADRALEQLSARRFRATDGWYAFWVEQRAMVAEMPGLWSALGTLPMPVTVIQGNHDRYVPRRAGAHLAERLGGRLVTVDGGHLLNLEVPDLLAEEVSRLCERAVWKGERHE